MAELKAYNPQAYASLQLTNPLTWSRAFFRIGTLYNDNLNNLSESFNRTIRQAKKKPLLDMLEDIRRQCMVRNAKCFVIADRMKTWFTKRAHAEIEKMIVGAGACQRYMARHNIHEVYQNGVGYSVDMNERTCGCKKWQMVGIPCVHDACVILGKREKVEDYVNACYTRIRWKETYMDGIRPVQGMKLWPRLNRLTVLPPPWRRGNPGRPSNYARRKGRNESSSSSNKMSREKRVMTCSNCFQQGHNKHGCKNPTVVASAPKRPRGRPRKNQEPQEPTVGSQARQGSQGPAVGSQAQKGSQGPAVGSHGEAGGSQRQEEQGLGRFASWFQCSS
ncbi:PREDICTED: uncharacterized protein LOC104709800 [Camelina sativa]|uniref:Uncharacterized protein LOC104709800 n=1 Tax=Camelina sativa TaxID=90675 RepID=A0ABM0TDC3_CAMSA|nr:PREDICTED: uncharacterized protein LOC104709800 [Camelina sativa]